MKYMIYTVKFTCFLICCQIPGILNHHDRAVIPFGIGADRTKLLICQRVTALTVLNILPCIGNGGGQLLHLVLRHIHDMKSQTLGGFRPDSRKVGQLLGAAEELGASAGTTQDKLVRNVVVAGTNVQYCDKVGTNGAHTAVTSRAGLDTTAKLTPDEVNKAVTLLKKLKAPKIDGKYVAIIHPSVAYDLRSSDAWVEAHKYAGITELFTGEIGELHGVRFIETTEAKVFNGEGCPVKTAADESNGTPAEYYSVYATLFLGKDAYGMIDPEGGNMEMIIKDKGQVGGPLNQFSTLGYKFSSAAKILYQDRMVRVESCGAYSAEDEAN